MLLYTPCMYILHTCVSTSTCVCSIHCTPHIQMYMYMYIRVGGSTVVMCTNVLYQNSRIVPPEIKGKIVYLQ